MALSDLSRDSLLPSFLYSSPAARSFAAASRFPSSPSPYQAPAAAPAVGLVGAGGVGGGRPFSIRAPNEKIEMYSPAFYAACTAGGIASCGLTHTAVTPLDLVKCNMQIDPAKYKSITSGFGVLLKEQGARGFFKGWVPTLLGYSAQGACKFGFYEFFKKTYSDMAGPENAVKYKTLIYLAWERAKDRLAVQRATREAHERAFAEARTKAERIALERITASRQRASAEARVKEKASDEAVAEKASREARIKAERAAVERATAEARERAIEKAKAAADAKERIEKARFPFKDSFKATNQDTQFQKTAPNNHGRSTDSCNQVSEFESALRHKARSERHQRTAERAEKALAEKNMRDMLAQREQTEKNRLAEFLDPEVKRWSNGKEGNLRALLSTLQYILGSDSGWQSVPLTDLITAAAVKKAYRKATLCVHPDKLQQRGATIRQKYICEKVFDLLKEAWNKFNSAER